MSGVPYHGWTHRPKALGGTDPIEVSSAVPFIEGFGALIVETPWTVDQEVPLEVGAVWTNDATTFDFNAGTGAVEITPSGVYLVRSKLEFNVSPVPDVTTISPDIIVEVVPPGSTDPIDEGGAQATWWNFAYRPPSFTPTTADECRFIQVATFEQVYHSSGGQPLIPYVRATAGTADWEAEVSMHVCRLGDLAAPFADWVYF